MLDVVAKFSKNLNKTTFVFSDFWQIQAAGSTPSGVWTAKSSKAASVAVSCAVASC